MRLILRFREFNYFRIRNWYGIRSGRVWSVLNESVYLLDLGAITFGFAIKKGF